jgi:hypothetical protein
MIARDGDSNLLARFLLRIVIVSVPVRGRSASLTLACAKSRFLALHPTKLLLRFTTWWAQYAISVPTAAGPNLQAL